MSEERAEALRQHEEGLPRLVVPAYRARLRQLLGSAKGRQKLRTQLAETKWHPDPRYAQRLAPGAEWSATLGPELRRRGAGDHCYVLSENDRAAGREMLLEDALVDVVDQGETALISCVPGRLAYFQDEYSDCYILERRQTS